MRIWHQSFTVLQDLGAYDTALREHFARVARPGTEIVMHGMRPGTYRTNYPGTDIRHVAVQHLHSLQFLAAARRAEKEGFDAYAISTLPDPALAEIRAAVRIPVVGLGESAMLASCLLGARFGVLVFIDELAELLARNASRYGLGERFAGARHVGFRFNDVLAAFADPEPLFVRFREAARGLIAAGADVIIPGEAPLCVLLATHGVTEVDGVPVIDSLAAWVKAAETLVDFAARGVRGCNRGYFHERPDPARLDELLSFYRLDEPARAS